MSQRPSTLIGADRHKVANGGIDTRALSLPLRDGRLAASGAFLGCNFQNSIYTVNTGNLGEKLVAFSKAPLVRNFEIQQHATLIL